MEAKRVVITKKDPTVVVPKYPRSPMGCIVADQQGHVFDFSSCLVSAKVEVVCDETIVFAAMIGEDGTVELPSELCGEYELRVYVGDSVYAANIEI